MDCPCGKFGDCIFSHFGYIVITDIQTDTQNQSQMRMNALLTQLSSRRK